MSSKNSSERIRERFLNKIGIETPSSSLSTMALFAQHNSTPEPPSCLGEVVPFYEPLKVCLDDDSSADDNSDDDDDDDFYFGDEHIDDMMIPNNFYKCGVSQASENIEMDIDNKPTSSLSLSALPPCDQDNVVLTSAQNTLLKSTSDSNLETRTSTPKAIVGFSLVSDSESISSSRLSATSNFSSASSLLGSVSESGSCTKKDEGNQGKRKRKRKVSLINDVSVVPIPMRNEYSDRVKERLWSNAAELYQNAARNAIEFAAEGWNWRSATEDEHMIYCQASGDMIHPIHVHNFLLEQGMHPLNPSSFPSDNATATKAIPKENNQFSEVASITTDVEMTQVKSQGKISLETTG